jgi:hypothetical protein
MRIRVLLTVLHRRPVGRHRRLVDPLGFGYSRDLDPHLPAAVPDGVDLYHFTGRTAQEATR